MPDAKVCAQFSAHYVTFVIKCQAMIMNLTNFIAVSSQLGSLDS